MVQGSLQFDQPDICRNRHKGARRSVEANERIQPFKVNVRERVRVMVASLEWNGATVHEIAAAMGKMPHQVSGRISELKALGKVFDSGREREGAAVLVADRKWVNGAAS